MGYRVQLTPEQKIRQKADLRSSDDKCRAAATACGGLSSLELDAALNDLSPEVRMAAYELGWRTDAQRLKAITDPDDDARSLAIEATQITQEEIQAVENAAEEFPISFAATVASQSISLSTLIRAVNHQHTIVCLAAVRRVAECGVELSRQLHDKLLAEAASPIKCIVIRLGGITDEQIADVIKTGSDDMRWTVASHCPITKQHIELLKTDPSPKVRACVPTAYVERASDECY